MALKCWFCFGFVLRGYSEVWLSIYFMKLVEFAVQIINTENVILVLVQ